MWILVHCCPHGNTIWGSHTPRSRKHGQAHSRVRWLELPSRSGTAPHLCTRCERATLYLVFAHWLACESKKVKNRVRLIKKKMADSIVIICFRIQLTLIVSMGNIPMCSMMPAEAPLQTDFVSKLSPSLTCKDVTGHWNVSLSCFPVHPRVVIDHRLLLFLQGGSWLFLLKVLKLLIFLLHLLLGNSQSNARRSSLSRGWCCCWCHLSILIALRSRGGQMADRFVSDRFELCAL